MGTRWKNRSAMWIGTPGAAEKGGYAHFMLKEIMEQDRVLRDTLRPPCPGGTDPAGAQAHHPGGFPGFATGSISSPAGPPAMWAMWPAPTSKSSPGCRVCVELASEFRYIDPIITPHTITIVISQSGETLDTLFALREAKSRGSKVLSIVNVVGSSIANESQDVIYTWAGPEIAVGHHQGLQRPAGGVLSGGPVHGPM